MTPLVSFITPTLCRSTLDATVRSVQNQTDDGWEHVIATDGKSLDRLPYGTSLAVLNSPRYKGVMAPKTYSAGLTRNTAIQHAHGKWLAFVDDDDTVDPRYVALLRVYDADPNPPDIVVFRGIWPNGMILPDPDKPRLEWSHVGISYAVKSDLMAVHPETNQMLHSFAAEDLSKPGPRGNEDIALLTDLLDSGAGVTICPYITYHVRPHERNRYGTE